MAPSWLHGDIARADAETLLGTEDGSFLVRARKSKGKVVEGEYVLSVVYKEKPTHHSVKTGDDGILTINGKPHGKKSSIDDLVQYLGQKRKGWPVALDKPVASGASTQSSDDTPATEPTPPVAETVADPPAATTPPPVDETVTPPQQEQPEASPHAADDTMGTNTAVETTATAPAIATHKLSAAAPRPSELWGKYPAVSAAGAAENGNGSGTQTPGRISLAKTVSGQSGYSPTSLGTPPVQRKKLTTMRGQVRQASPPPVTSHTAVPWSSVTLKSTKDPGAALLPTQPPAVAVTQSDSPSGTPTWVESDPQEPPVGAPTPASIEGSTAYAGAVTSSSNPVTSSSAQGMQVARVDNWGSKVPQHKIRVYEVLRKLFSEADNDDPEAKKLYLSRGDLETRITLDELEHVLEGVGAFDPNDGAYKLLDIFLRCSPGADGTTSLGEFLARCDPAQARAAREKAQQERAALAARLFQQQQVHAARDAARIEAERRATETAIANARLEEVAKQRELQEKLYREELARIDEMRRAEQARIAQEQAEYHRQQEEAIAREKELKQRRMREKHERWKARQMPMPWEVPVDSEMV